MQNRVMQCVKEHKLISIVRGIAPQLCRSLASALYAGGIRMIEITFDQESHDEYAATTTAIRCLAQEFPEILVGAGTVVTLKQLELARDAGAQYIISPNADPVIIRRTKDFGLVSMPGAMTPSEMVRAYNAGADAIKVFPAGILGPDYIKAVRAPLKHIPLMAVGGINENNIAEYLKAGVIGAGVGGNLVNKEWIEGGAFDNITALAKRFVAACK